MAAVKEEPKQETKRQVQMRIANWRRRIEALYDQIEAWATREWGDGCVVRGTAPQAEEYMMRKLHIPPGKLPTLTVRAGNRTIEFSPRCLWIIGANGQLDVMAGGRHYHLSDRGGTNGRASYWEIDNPDPRIILEPFTRKVLARIAGKKS